MSEVPPGHYVGHKNSRWGPLRGVTQLRPARGIGSAGATCRLLFCNLSKLWILCGTGSRGGSAGISTQMHRHKEECGRRSIVNSSRVEGTVLRSKAQPTTSEVAIQLEIQKAESRPNFNSENPRECKFHWHTVMSAFNSHMYTNTKYIIYLSSRNSTNVIQTLLEDRNKHNKFKLLCQSC